MEQQGAAGSWEREVAQFIKDDGVGVDQLFGQVPSLALLFLPLQLVHQIDRVVEADAFAVVDGGHPKSRRQVRLAGPGSTHQDQIVRGFHKASTGQLLDLRLRQRRFRPIDPGQIPMHREARRFKLIAQASHLAIGQFGVNQPVQPGFGLHRPPWPLSRQLAPGGRHAIQMQRIELGQAVHARWVNERHGSPRADDRSGRNQRAAQAGASACRARSTGSAASAQAVDASRSSPRVR